MPAWQTGKHRAALLPGAGCLPRQGQPRRPFRPGGDDRRSRARQRAGVGHHEVVALALQGVLAAGAHLSAATALAISLAASAAGAAGARIWFVVLSRGKIAGIPTQGLCIQGFILGAVVVLIPGVALAGLPVGTFLDVTTPGLFFSMSIGRQGAHRGHRGRHRGLMVVLECDQSAPNYP
jgi:hypothetical protein